MTVGLVHHSAICVADITESTRFWCQGLGFSVLMDEQFTGDWPTLLDAPSRSLRSVFLGDPAHPDSGIVELVDLGPDSPGQRSSGGPAKGFLLLSVMTDLDRALDRLRSLGLGGVPRRIEVAGIAMAVVRDPDGVQVELIDTGALSNLERLRESDR